ncbi:MAG: hypothetical protein ACK559_18990, partial [bacterium]
MGLATNAILERELELLDAIEVKIHRIILLKGRSMAEELDQETVRELQELEEGLQADWMEAAPLDYLRGFDRQVQPDDFFENLIAGSRDALVGLQTAVQRAENRLRQEWLAE